MDTISTCIATHEAGLIQLRRDLHRHPELGFREARTSALVADELEGLSFRVRRGVGGTGVVARLEGSGPGPTVLLRADMDALPIETKLETEYRSSTPGVMHACGHDGHTAILLTVARVLSEVRERLKGSVLLVFQPAEEMLEGARAMLEDGALDGEEPKHALGLHLINDLPVGTVHVRHGPVMAGSSRFDLTVTGSGGHSAKPHQYVNPIDVAQHVLAAMQHVVGEAHSPIDPVTFSVTSFHAGDGYNVVPESAALKGMVRCFSREIESLLVGRLTDCAALAAHSMRARAEFSWTKMVPPVVNDAAVSAVVREAAQQVVGTANVHTADLRMSSEDVSLWLERVPGCYFFVGTRNEAKGLAAPHHNPRFDIDESALRVGVEVLVRSLLALSGTGQVAGPGLGSHLSG